MLKIRRKAALSYIINILKDKASLTKRFLLFKPKTTALHFAILRSTTHSPSPPPPKKHITVILSYGHGSRRTAATCIKALLTRLSKTRNSFVAFKSLLIIHTIIQQGSFILRDQLLSAFSSLNGRKKHLNFSSFVDPSTHETWNLSFWVRWYARFLELLIYNSRNSVLGFCSQAKDEEERVSSLSNNDLLRELEVMVTLIEEICRAPEMFNVQARRLVYEAMSLVGEDKKSVENKIMMGVNEVRERLDSLNYGDSVELVCVLNRFENCKERILLLFLNNENSVGDRLWGLVAELRDKIGRAGVSESTRPESGELRGDSVRFGSVRVSSVRVLRMVFESIKFM